MTAMKMRIPGCLSVRVPAKQLISLGARLTDQELHDTLLSAILRGNDNAYNAKLLVKMGARLTEQELHDYLP